MMFAFRSLSASMASLALAIVVSSPASAQSNTANEAMMNLVLQVQQLQDEIRMLRGQLESFHNIIKKFQAFKKEAKSWADSCACTENKDQGHFVVRLCSILGRE